jgi:hypothetical protein
MRRLTTRECHITLLAWVLSAGVAADALAQGTAASRGWEISGGGVYVGGYDLGDRTAELTSNSGTSGGSFTLFETDSRVKPAFGVLARIGYFLTPVFAVEGVIRFTRPTFEIRNTDDFEDAADVTSMETLSQYLFDASAVWHFSSTSPGRVTPFVYGGAGYLRELHEGDALVEEGVEYHAGGGIKWWFGAGRRFGVRGEAGISMRDGGFDFEEGVRVVPVVSGSLIYLF